MKSLIFILILTCAMLSNAQIQPATLNNSSEFILHSQYSHKDYRIQFSQVGNAPSSGYPVLYILDGDYLFPPAVMSALINHHQPLLIVGIGYPTGKLLSPNLRAQDYTPPNKNNQPIENTGDLKNNQFGGANLFSQFIQQELNPQLAKLFPINLNQQAIFGHSYGGLYALYDLLTKQNFNHYLLASPSIWWNNKSVLQYLPDFMANPPNQKITVRLTGGEYEQTLPPNQQNNPKRQAILDKRAMLTNIQQLYKQLSEIENIQTEIKIYPKQNHQSVAIPVLLDQVLGFRVQVSEIAGIRNK